VKDLVHCVLGLPLLPPGDMLQALQEIRSTIHDDDEFSRQKQVRYFPVLHFQRPRYHHRVVQHPMQDVTILVYVISKFQIEDNLSTQTSRPSVGRRAALAAYPWSGSVSWCLAKG